ncbi:MAG TPA: glycerophosphodiester phosphodiesterase [Rectinemataceae bacterium]|nr:glycerophosphodiester phosphodiesterase [Rectinemataceae bacterium]
MSVKRKQPLITAHAGCMGTLPNSRESFVAAFSSKADIVEADIRSTRDGIAVLTHDDVLSIDGSAPVKVGGLDWAEIGALVDSGRADGIMRLEMYLDLAAELDSTIRGGASTVLNLDIKEAAILGAVAKLVRDRGLGSKVLFSGLELDGLRKARETLAGLRYLFNADAGDEAACGRVCSIAAEFGCAGINLEWMKASRFFVHSARDAGFQVMLWTVDKVEDMKTILNLSPDSITTNRPDILAHMMAEMTKRMEG